MELAQDHVAWRSLLLEMLNFLVLLPELVFRYQNGLFLFQRWKAEASLGRDGDVLPKLVARRMGGLHYGSGTTANCPPAVVAECARN